MEELVFGSYLIYWLVIFGFESSRLMMVYYFLRHCKRRNQPPPSRFDWPAVTVQLPVYNELYVIRRLIHATCGIRYPKQKLEIQVLDDSSDETTIVIEECVTEMRGRGFDIQHFRRATRKGFKAGALKYGLERAEGEFIAVFDADFVPGEDFLERTLPFFCDPRIGMVQTRWEHLNSEYSLLTRVQAVALDAHFVIEQAMRNISGFFINFTGTGGIWRKSCILDAGNWEGDTLTEDLDLSYRAQLRGWKFKFLSEVTSPAELPTEINALKTQQFRWTKGAIETARKILPRVWRSKLPLLQKLHSTTHLGNNIVYPLVLLASILNVPLVFIKHGGSSTTYFVVMFAFAFTMVGWFLFYFCSQKEIRGDWRKRVLVLPILLAGSMGFSVNNTQAVVEGLLKIKSEFVRTPKYQIVGRGESWWTRKYVLQSIHYSSYVELLLALYCMGGAVLSIYLQEYSAIPFQLMFALGFGYVSLFSFRHAFLARRGQMRVERSGLKARGSFAGGTVHQ